MKTDLTVAGYIFYDNHLLLVEHKKLGLWLPVGGHIEPGEIPDEAMLREAKEEVGLDIKIIDLGDQSYRGENEIERCAMAFHSNVHPVGDHYHYCQFFLCESDNKELSINEREISDAKWVSFTDLNNALSNIRPKGLEFLAFKRYGEIKHAVD